MARRYATALLDWAESLGEAEELYGQIVDRVESVCSLHEVRQGLCNPILTNEQKEALVAEAVGEQMPQSWRRFVEVVVGHNREALLGNFAHTYAELYRKAHGIIRAELTVAREIDEPTRARIEALIREQGAERVEMVVSIRPDIDGGFVLRLADRLLDASVKGQLERIRRILTEKNRNIV